MEKTRPQKVQEAIERFDRLVDGNPFKSPPSIHSEMFRVIFEDNATLIEEIVRLKQELLDLRIQKRVENVRELEAQFPRKGRRRRASV